MTVINKEASSCCEVTGMQGNPKGGFVVQYDYYQFVGRIVNLYATLRIIDSYSSVVTGIRKTTFDNAGNRMQLKLDNGVSMHSFVINR